MKKTNQNKNTLQKNLKKVELKQKLDQKINKSNLKGKKNKKKLGMGLSSLLSKDQELASVIKKKVKDQINSSSLKIQIPKL